VDEQTSQSLGLRRIYTVATTLVQRRRVSLVRNLLRRWRCMCGFARSELLAGKRVSKSSREKRDDLAYPSRMASTEGALRVRRMSAHSHPPK